MSRGLRLRGGVVVAGVAFVVACSGSSAPNIGGASSGTSSGGEQGPIPAVPSLPEAGVGPEAGPSDGGRDSGPTDPRCPASFDDRSGDGLCQVGLRCMYPEGTCECLPPCGGAPPPEDGPGRWTCTRKVVGCPPAAPPDNKACNVEGVECSYGGCCADRFFCAGGKWTRLSVICPPSPQP